MSRNLIRLSNRRAWVALAAVRILRAPFTMAELRDALNARQRARNAALSPAEQAALDAHYMSQLRTYGRVEVPPRMEP